MELDVRKAEYYRITVDDRIAGAAKTLTAIADAGVDFLAYKAEPSGPGRTRFTLFAIQSSTLAAAVEKTGLKWDGPRPAVLVRGAEKPGALAMIYSLLSQAGVRVGESAGMAHINGWYGVLLYLDAEACEKAIEALGR